MVIFVDAHLAGVGSCVGYTGAVIGIDVSWGNGLDVNESSLGARGSLIGGVIVLGDIFVVLKHNTPHGVLSPALPDPLTPTPSTAWLENLVACRVSSRHSPEIDRLKLNVRILQLGCKFIPTTLILKSAAAELPCLLPEMNGATTLRPAMGMPLRACGRVVRNVHCILAL